MLKKTLNEGTQFFKGPGKLTKSANIMDTPFARSLGRRDSALFRRFSEGSSTDLKQAQLYEVVDPHNSLPPPSGVGPDYLMVLGTVFFWIVFALNTAGLTYVILKVLKFLDPKK